MKKRTLPKKEESISRVYLDCEKRKRFRAVDKDSFPDYVLRGQKDMASAENDFNTCDYH